MNELPQILSDCYVMGIRLTAAVGDGLTIDAPQGLLTPERIARLKTHKGELIAHLREEAQCYGGYEHEWEDTLERDGKTRRFCQRCRKFSGFVQPDGSIKPPAPISPSAFGFACDHRLPVPGECCDQEVTLTPCVRCGSLELWESLKSGSLRCMKCDPPMKTFEELKAQAVELQQTSN